MCIMGPQTEAIADIVPVAIASQYTCKHAALCVPKKQPADSEAIVNCPGKIKPMKTKDTRRMGAGGRG